MGRQSKLTPQLQKKIVSLLSKGVTDKDTCELVGISKDTFYRWIAVGDAVISGSQHEHIPPDDTEKQKYSDFSDSVSRARARATNKAIDAFRTGLMPSVINEEITVEVAETRLKRDGTPYEYVKRETRTVVRHMPPDWRAGMEWLQRRDKETWSLRQEVTGKDGGAIPLAIVKMPVDEL